MSWIPILVLFSILDRNPVCAEDIRGQMLDYIHQVRCALLEQTQRQQLCKFLLLEEDEYNWVDPVSGEPLYM
jgi:hypothetical protein